jgi:hypothetical protein
MAPVMGSERRFAPLASLRHEPSGRLVRVRHKPSGVVTWRVPRSGRGREAPLRTLGGWRQRPPQLIEHGGGLRVETHERRPRTGNVARFASELDLL